MKYFFAFLIFNISLSLFCSDNAIKFYVFEKSDFEKSILKDKKIADLKKSEIVSNDKILFEGILLPQPTYLKFSFKEKELQIQFGKYENKDKKEINLWWYNFSVFYKEPKSHIMIKGNVEMLGLNKLSINMDWKKSKYVVFFIERHCRFSGGVIWLYQPASEIIKK